MAMEGKRTKRKHPFASVNDRKKSQKKVTKKSVKKTKKNLKSKSKNLGKYARTGGPGRPKGSRNHRGLQTVLNMFEDLVSSENNLKKLKAALQRQIDKAPIKTFDRFIMPLLPRPTVLTDHEGKDIPIQIILRGISMKDYPKDQR